MSDNLTPLPRTVLASLPATQPPTLRPVAKPAETSPAPGLAADKPPQIGYATRLPAKTFALTFDDGPNPVTTPKILATLKDHGVKATFFVTGQNAQRYPELVRQIVAEGHELGSHTWDHPQLTKLTAAQITAQLDRTQAAVDAALGYPYPLKQVRPPYGAVNATVQATIAAKGASVVMWQIDSNDWRYKNNDQAILQHVLEGPNSLATRGGVVLFHDIHPQTVRVLDTVLRYAKNHHLQGTTSGAYLEAMRAHKSE